MNAMMTEQYDMHLKLLMLGDTGVGKTCLLLRYAFDSFSPTFITTIGIDFKIKEVQARRQSKSMARRICVFTHLITRTMRRSSLTVKLQIWDTAGQERFRTITVSYFKGAHGIILVYDVSERDSFQNIQHWVHQIRENADDRVRLVLVGNKCDREESRVVSTKEGEELARQYGVSFFETSAKDNKNVDECYTTIARETKDALISFENDRRQAEATASRMPTVSFDGSKEGIHRARRRCCA
ncbi:hypothetical protein CTAYLR_006040 [Chrysophaeum taylorii]|uniref:Uncharacterized protein n=1 Tax=Chrysophaeum taylorii TaxID=2483200 RepID=A0AAD7UJR6_9STRA|nr:hypothetical protein CTAYLR_006040 [Chrysophaeum taylorii]